MGMKRWEVRVLSLAKKQMGEIKDRRIQERLAIALRRLEYAPDQQGKQLADELVEYRGIRAVSQRYRIIYHLRDDVNIVFIVGIGIRKDGDKKDIYTQIKRLLRQGIFNLNIEIEDIVNERQENALSSAIPFVSSNAEINLADGESSPNASSPSPEAEDH
jgi:mRNA interferase RelE/StbE